MKNRKATVGDVLKINKVIRKAHSDESSVVFSRIDNFENLKIIGFGDASFEKLEHQTKSVEGRIIFLSNGRKASPLMWKSKKISQVCESTKRKKQEQLIS